MKLADGGEGSCRKAIGVMKRRARRGSGVMMVSMIMG